MEWLTDNPWVAWVGVALILAAIEAATVDFVFVMLAGGALAGGLAAGLGGNATVQVIVAIIVGGLLLFVVRPIVKRKFTEGELDHSIGASSLVGREARVLQTVTDTDGRIKLAGETWSARIAQGSEPLRPGDDARVIAIHGATAIVAADRH
ncbi:NfeD family protein [Knoellia subterranea]|uniref:Membrane protein n=1 Tax=Knoellia subterranea KCTC 19937 TaxID=1385521 RepID=A0A0A0JNK0_9MICO|nr:NfeD family protein [Knoellia subterranea]KGN38723.1 membrane protein [Knoellia subterranea KCTC 19937]